MTYCVLFFIELPTRAVRIGGITTNPAEAWMLQIARNAFDVDDGVLPEGTKVLIDRDAKYSGNWRAFLEEQGVEVIRLPPKSPALNAYAERFVRSIKDECLNRMIFIGEAARGAPSVNSWRITMPSGIIKAWVTGSSAPTNPQFQRLARWNDESGSVGC